jgi:T-complex protein 1 subunit theta
VKKAKVAVYTSALDITQSETKGTVLIKNKEEMLNFTRGEEKHMEKVHLMEEPPKLYSDPKTI